MFIVNIVDVAIIITIIGRLSWKPLPLYERVEMTYLVFASTWAVFEKDFAILESLNYLKSGRIS